MQALGDDLKARVHKIRQGGGEKAREKHLSRGKMLPRDRVRTLLDPGSPFLELSQFAAYDMYGGDIHAAGVITGIGRVQGRECVIVRSEEHTSELQSLMRISYAVFCLKKKKTKRTQS